MSTFAARTTPVDVDTPCTVCGEPYGKHRSYGACPEYWYLTVLQIEFRRSGTSVRNDVIASSTPMLTHDAIDAYLEARQREYGAPCTLLNIVPLNGR